MFHLFTTVSSVVLYPNGIFINCMKVLILHKFFVIVLHIDIMN